MTEQLERRPDLITTYGETSPFAEAYRVLRMSLFQGNGKPPLWSLGITGAGPQHGSTTTAVNLGLIMTETGKRVVLVDGDLYKPSIHQRFNIPNEVGFSTVLQGEASLERALQTVTDPPLLRVLPAGPQVRNPTALLQPRALSAFFDRIRSEADFFILDLPSVVAVAYTSFLASFMDGLLLVVRAGTTSVGVDRIVKRRLHGVNVIGIVLNQASLDGIEASPYRYYAQAKT